MGGSSLRQPFDALRNRGAFCECEFEHGRAEGLIDGLALALELKFGVAAAPIIAEVRQIADLGQIEAIMAKIKTAESLSELNPIMSD